MKTLYGITFQELHNLELDEVKDKMVSFAIKSIHDNLPKEEPFNDPAFRQKFIDIGVKHMLALFGTCSMEENIDDMRKIYDTEERFDIALRMMDRMGDLSIKLQGMMNNIIEEALGSLL